MLKYCILSVTLGLSLLGCKIQESEQGLMGSVYVTLRDSTGAAVARASIWLDGHETSQRTPAILSGLTVGNHVIGATRPDTYEALDTVAVLFHDTVSVALTAAYRPLGPVELVSAPDNTVLIVDRVPSGITPPTVLYTGIGSHRASAFLEGNATELPSLWIINVAQNDTARLPVAFTPLESGGSVDQLAPPYDLVSDWDTLRFRLQDYRGMVLLVTFFYTDCAPCVAEMPAIQSVYTDTSFTGRVEFFAIDPNDDYYTFSQFRTVNHPELGLTFVLLHDPGQPTKTAYGVQQFPTNFIVDQTGRIRYRYGSITRDILHDAIAGLLAESP